MKRIRYISSFAEPMDHAAIEALAHHAEQRNRRVDVTGILVAAGDLFFQIIEGPDASVDALMGRIATDPRHHRIVVLSVEHGELTRMCPDWAMRKVELSRESADRAAPVQTLMRIAYHQRRLADEAVEALETFTWRAFIDAEIEALRSEV